MKEDKFVKVTTVDSIAEAEQILQVLKQNGIEGYRQGGVLDVYIGNSNAGEDVFIHATDAEKAQKILASFEPIRVSSGTSQASSSIMRILGFVALGILLLGIAASLYTAVF